MGAQTFFTTARGKTPDEAWSNAITQGYHDYGHRGYTGSIAEKAGRGYILIALPDGDNAHVFAEKLVSDGDARIDSKWGPAGCVKVAEGEYLFFGWASS